MSKLKNAPSTLDKFKVAQIIAGNDKIIKELLLSGKIQKKKKIIVIL